MIDVESQVFSRILYDFSETLKTKYNLSFENFSTEGKSNSDAVFPFIYIHLLPSIENNQDLENQDINSGLYTVEIDVKDNSDPVIAQEIMNECIKLMKGMRFGIIQMPSFDYSQTSIYRQVIRCRRLIGSEDIL